jgi:hypothetical protein
MATNEQINANHQNSQKSTGPTTEAGKQRSALNATRHGFTGQAVALTAEEAEPYRLFTEGFLADLAPKGTHETQLVQSIVDARWRMNQIAAMESAIYALGHRQHAEEFKNETLASTARPPKTKQPSPNSKPSAKPANSNNGKTLARSSSNSTTTANPGTQPILALFGHGKKSSSASRFSTPFSSPNAMSPSKI